VQLVFSDAARIVFRLSGTGTEGATLRLYLERYEADASRQFLPVGEVLADLGKFAIDLAEVEPRTGRSRPTAIT
jgi:phosphoglucomutase